MTTPVVIKAFREGYSPSPFFFRQEYQPGEKRWAAWTNSLDRLKTLFYRVLGGFPDSVEVLLKIKRESGGESPDDEWQRYHGFAQREDLSAVIRSHEEFVFQDGGNQVCIMPAGGGDYIALDDHGIFFLYAEHEGFADLFREMGFVEREEPLICDEGHWHWRPGNPNEQVDSLVRRLRLTAV